MEGRTAAQDLKDGASQGPDVRAMVAALIFNDLFGHELRRSHVVLEDLMSRGIPGTWQVKKGKTHHIFWPSNLVEDKLRLYV